MITKITELNQDEYKYLFDEAKNILNVDDINSLDTYFLRIKDLAEKDLHFMVLPLDEETFNIDANTRTISIPRAFSTNGISVQGDNSAEIVFFTIDRYFDSTDLKNKRIFIQWERPDGKKGLSPNFYKDTTLIPGKILFGWVITSDLTKIPGRLKFSVRFWSQEGEEINYSLSTLASEVRVNSGLDFNLNEIEYIPNEELENIILSKIENSNAEDLPVPAPPIVLGAAVEGLLPAQTNKYKIIYKGYSDLGYLITKDGSEILYAYGNSDGDILYVWKKQNDLGDWITLPEDSSGIDYISLEDLGEKYVPSTVTGEQGIYYYKENDNYFVASSDYITNNPTSVLYRKAGYLKISDPGTYKVTLITRQLNNQSENVKNPEINFYFFNPRELIGIDLSEDTVILEKNNISYEPILNQLNYTVEQINNSDLEKIIIEGKSCLYGEDELMSTWPETLNLHFDREVLTYKWYFSKDLSPDSWIELENTSGNLELNRDEEKDYSDFVGYYKTEITNNRNKKSSNTISHYYRLNYKPIAPKSISFSGLTAVGNLLKVYVDVSNIPEYENLKYEWSINNEILGTSDSFRIPTSNIPAGSILKCKVQSILGGKMSEFISVEEEIYNI